MFTVAVVEDDENAAARLRGCLARYEADHPGVVFDVTGFREPTSFLEPYRASWDIVFMDIEMPNMDGMEAARRLRELDSETILIFVTNMAQFAAKGYEVDALDYIIKPFSYPDFERKLGRAVAIREEASAAVMIMQRGGTRRVRLRDISYIEVRDHALLYHTQSGVVTGSGTLQDVVDKLGPRGFLRCSKAFVVNNRHIAAVAGNELELADGGTLAIGRAYKKQFMIDLAASMADGTVL
ncbi:DNA-binding response regulator [Bifidobacterium ramosum]|uniref:Response regulator n=1 Tax=Bifidobacterium ramosum TaxID=1798158 RepID=A0A6L4WYD7_9BIFI|nr:LytTR family DNA-binding domain-containing protein [Bifidobacterium ramosum]KAB8286635.1 DNA-binding response regulator [Bifidobacterium ramosum]NEG72816.1 response regulator [Bifidobacterium ramosum]